MRDLHRGLCTPWMLSPSSLVFLPPTSSAELPADVAGGPGHWTRSCHMEQRPSPLPGDALCRVGLGQGCWALSHGGLGSGKPVPCGLGGSGHEQAEKKGKGTSTHRACGHGRPELSLTLPPSTRPATPTSESQRPPSPDTAIGRGLGVRPTHSSSESPRGCTRAALFPAVRARRAGQGVKKREPRRLHSGRSSLSRHLVVSYPSFSGRLD